MNRYFMSLNRKNGNYWLRKRAVANSTPVSDVSSTTKVKKVTKQIKSGTMLSHVPLASEEEYIVAVPDSEDSSSDSDESDCEKGLNPEPGEISTLSLHVPDKLDESSQGTSDQQHQEENQEDQEKTEQKSDDPHNTDSETEVVNTHLTKTAAEQAGRLVRKVREAARRWRVTHHNLLPDWLKDNDFLHFGHRPQIPSFRSCFGSIFRIHTETGNIWTHLLGFIAFVILMIYFLVDSIIDQESWDKIVVYMAFFTGAIMCMFFSWVFHTVYCHSSKTSLIFSKLDYSGISLLIVGSFIPWLYFGFYCHNVLRYIYISLILLLGSICMFVALRDKFSQRKFRGLRAGLFLGLGLSAIIPAMHFLAISGIVEAFQHCAFGWILLMAGLYILGAIVYAVRIRRDSFQESAIYGHQFFHVLVVAAAFVHYHGLNLMVSYREEIGKCAVDILDEDV